MNKEDEYNSKKDAWTWFKRTIIILRKYRWLFQVAKARNHPKKHGEIMNAYLVRSTIINYLICWSDTDDGYAYWKNKHLVLYKALYGHSDLQFL